jgi:uncharacterized protein
MTSSFLLDLNVWVALNYGRHQHHVVANRWYVALPDEARLVFCRQTQLGLFRLLSTASVMQQDALTQKACWAVFDKWADTGQVRWADDPGGLDQLLRRLTDSETVSPKAWMDAYLAAFAEAAGLTLVTFDRALAERTTGAVLLS